MQKHRLNRAGLVLLALLLVVLSVSGAAANAASDFDTNRARLLGHMVQQQLTQHHYTQKQVDDDLSRAAYGLYLKQLDFQKRFLLKSDVEQLDQ